MTGARSKLDGRGFVPADFDRDGDIDLFVVNNNQPCVYLENRVGQLRNWSAVQLEGRADNRFGIGARVRLTAAGVTQTREIHIGSGYLSSPPPEAHFGLGDAETIERLEVVWPNGQRQVFEQLDPGRIIVVEQGGSMRYLAPGGRTGPTRTP